MRPFFLLPALLFVLAARAAAAEVDGKNTPGFRLEPNTPAEVAALADKPVTAFPGPAGELLKKWYAEKTVAGNVGDVYDNRDRGHSGLDMSQFPQLKRTVYNDAALKLHLDWGGALQHLPLVIFGNSSTSGGPTTGGSNPRMIYSVPRGLRALEGQYRSNNLYIYPEHCDYKPGHNGSPGYGDLYPTNTPYVLISQGSSGSDQPFMHAVPLVWAALRGDVKQKLAQNGLLAPTLQMIFRSTAKQLTGPSDYLTGKAHPPVFDGAWVDPLSMVRMAHDITVDRLPPHVQLAVIDEDKPAAGRDYFERQGVTEELGTTPSVIARVGRGRAYAHRLVVSAGDSFDLNHRRLEYHWKLLRGDPAKVSLKFLAPSRVAAEVVVQWHDRYPIAAGSAMESNRVDIGVFVHNGVYYSAPAFITFLFLDSEARSYDATGRLLEIGYGMGDLDVQADDLTPLFEAFQPGGNVPGGKLLQAAFSAPQAAAIAAAAEPYRTHRAAWQAAIKEREKAEAAHLPEKELARRREAETAARTACQQVLDGGRPLVHDSFDKALLAPLRAMATDPYLFRSSGPIAREVLQSAVQKAAFRNLSAPFVRWGLFRAAADSPEMLELTPLRKAAATDAAALTRFERSLLERFHGQWLEQFVYRDRARISFRPNFVDPNIAAPKSWRDVYHYDAKGECTGWTRSSDAGASEFSADGNLVLERDSAGIARKTQAVSYEQEVPKSDPANPLRGPNRSALRWKVRE